MIVSISTAGANVVFVPNMDLIWTWSR